MENTKGRVFITKQFQINDNNDLIDIYSLFNFYNDGNKIIVELNNNDNKAKLKIILKKFNPDYICFVTGYNYAGLPDSKTKWHIYFIIPYSTII